MTSADPVGDRKLYYLGTRSVTAIKATESTASREERLQLHVVGVH